MPAYITDDQINTVWEDKKYTYSKNIDKRLSFIFLL